LPRHPAVAYLFLVRPMTNLRRLLCLIVIGATAVGVVADSPYTTHGVTADGQVITAPPKTHRPWASDLIKTVKPELPTELRSNRRGGEAFCRVLLDVSSGTVRDVVVEKSSGYPALDANIVKALRQWKLKPGRWKEFEIYVGRGGRFGPSEALTIR